MLFNIFLKYKYKKAEFSAVLHKSFYWQNMREREHNIKAANNIRDR